MAKPDRTEADRRRIWQLVGLAAAGVAVAVVWIFAVVSGSGGRPHPTGGSPDIYPNETIPPPRERSLSRAAAAAGCTVRSFPSYGRQHTTERVRYRTNPPTSGPHYPTPAEDGIYDLAPSTERLVRSLEQGRVIFQFVPGAPPKVRGQLKALTKEDGRHVILTANATGMPFEVAATAWRHYVGCRQVTPATFDALRDFKNQYRDRGPE